MKNGFSSQNGYSPGNAQYWGSYFSSRGFTVNGTPQVGSVAWWNANQGPAYSSGHVAYVEAVHKDANGNVTSIDVSEDNWQYGPFDWKNITVGSSNYPVGNSTTSGFIHLPTPPPPPTDTDGDGVPDSSDWCMYAPGPASNHGCPQNNIQISGDLNGDGKADVIAISKSSSDNSPYIYWFQSTSTSGSPSVADPVLLEHLSASSGWNMNKLKWAVGDFNGDGKADLFVASGVPSTGQTVMYVLLSTGTGLASPTWVKSPDPAAGWKWPLLTFMAGDVNGDGKADVFSISRNTSDNAPYIYSFNSTSSGSTASLADAVLLENLPAPSWNMGYLKWATIDADGDGKVDFFTASRDSNTGAAVLYILPSTGTALASPVGVKSPGIYWQWSLLTF